MYIFLATSSKIRMDLVRAVGIAMIQFLRGKSDDLYKDMNDWLGAKFLKEIERWIICSNHAYIN